MRTPQAHYFFAVLLGALGTLSCAPTARTAADTATPPETVATAARDASGSRDGATAGGSEPSAAPHGDASETGTANDDATTREPPAPKHAPPKAGEEIDLSAADCAVLADTYASAWRADAHAKEALKKDPKLQQLAEKNIAAAAETARENWLRACHSIVGAAFIRSRLVCASKAKTVARFDACWDGKPTD
ncbi:MAG: hypothetical protein EXR75_11980 [Myxococcales bacterium]|nr:hypothetical protein [Myxococcales bacterium]